MPAALPVHVRRLPTIDPDPPYDDLATTPAPVARTPRRRPDLHLVPSGVRERAPSPPDSVDRRARHLARAVLEVLSGDRPLQQLSRWMTPEVYSALEPLVRSRTPRPWAASLRRVRICRPAPDVAEVAAVFDRGDRTAALALRLEGPEGTWRLTAVQIG